MELSHSFKSVQLGPGYIGIHIRKNGTIKNIEPDVQESLQNAGVNINWIMTKIENQKFSKKLLLQKANGTKNYQIEFTVGKCVQPAPEEEKERTKKNEEKDDAVKKENVNFRNKLNKAMEKNKKAKTKSIAPVPGTSATTLLTKNLNPSHKSAIHHELLGIDLEDYDCSICSDIFALPTSLLCGHTFCFECIYTWYLVHKNLQCPICRENIHQIPINYQLILKSQIDRHFENQPGNQLEYKARIQRGEKFRGEAKEKEREMKANPPPPSSSSSYEDSSEESSSYFSDEAEEEGQQERRPQRPIISNSSSFSSSASSSSHMRQFRAEQRRRRRRPLKWHEKIRKKFRTLLRSWNCMGQQPRHHHRRTR